MNPVQQLLQQMALNAKQDAGQMTAPNALQPNSPNRNMITNMAMKNMVGGMTGEVAPVQDGAAIATNALSKLKNVQSMIPNNVAEDVGQLSQTLQSGKNIPIEAHQRVMQYAKQYLKIPEKIFAKMGTDDILAELNGVMSKNQSYAYQDLLKR